MARERDSCLFAVGLSEGPVRPEFWRRNFLCEMPPHRIFGATEGVSAHGPGGNCGVQCSCLSAVAAQALNNASGNRSESSSLTISRL